MGQLERTRLLTPLVADPRRNWCVVAGAGMGKTALLRQLHESSERSLLIAAAAFPEFSIRLRSDLGRMDPALWLPDQSSADELAAAARRLRLLIVDDVHRLDDAGADLLLLIAATGTKVVVGGRTVPHRIAQASPAWEMIDPASLAFTPVEIASLLDSQGTDQAQKAADIVEELTGGWPLAVERAVGELQGPDPRATLHRLLRENALVVRLSEEFLSSLSDEDRRAARSLAELPQFDETIAELLGDADLLGRLARAGVPLMNVGDWMEFGEHFRSAVMRSQPRSTPLSRQIPDHFVARGEYHTAIGVCLGAGLPEMAAQVIGSFTPDQEARLDADRLNAAMVTIGDAATAAPRSLYVLGHTLAINSRSEEGLQYVERAAQAFRETDPTQSDPDHLETLLTMGMWRVFDGQFDRAWKLLETCEQRVRDLDDPVLLGRLHDLRGLLFHAGGSEVDLEKATEEMTLALSIWRRLGHARDAAVTTTRLAAGILPARGRRNDALTILDELPDVGPMAPLDQARIGIHRARLLPYVGRASEVTDALVDPRRVAELMQDDDLLMSADHAEIIAASMLGDLATVEIVANRFVAAAAFTDLTTALMFCGVIEAMARVGLADRAEASLELVREVPGIEPWILDYATATVAVRSGRHEDGLAILERLVSLPEVEKEKRWLIDYLRAYAHWQGGSDHQASKLEAEARTKARELGRPDLAEITEPALVAQMADGSPPDPESSGSFYIGLFDEFHVQVDGQTLRVPSGQSRNLLKILVLGGGRLLVDQVIDPLWPEADLQVGRRRLRNVVRRVREACGDILERDGATIALMGTVRSDFEDAVRAAELAIADRTTATVHEAIRLNDRALLPDDRYEEWAEDARATHDTLLVQLLDLVAELAQRDGDVDGAVQALMRADQLQLIPGERRARAALLLRRAGREPDAAQVEQSDQ